LGHRITKGVLLRRKGAGYQLQNYVLADAPMYEKTASVESVSDHLLEVTRALGATTKHLALAVGTGNALLCHAELPVASPSDLRRMVKLSPKTYLQQDLPDYLFDCYTKTDPTQDPAARSRRKVKALVGGARRRLVETLQDAAQDAGLVVEQITLGQVGLVNAFKMLPGDSHGEVVALVDIGFNHSTISIVLKDELALTRVVPIGSERFTQVTSPGQGRKAIDGAGAAVPLTEAMQAKLQNLIVLLAKEVDASIGFFVNQCEVPVNQVYVSGGSARSQFIVQTLETELGLPCESWNPTRSLTLNLPSRQMQEIDYDAAQLGTAIGAGWGCLDQETISINLLSEQQEAVEMRRRDPVRRGSFIAATAVLLMLAWAGLLGFRIWHADSLLKRQQGDLLTLERNSKEALESFSHATEIERTLGALNRVAANRFLWAPTLNALQFTTAPDIEFHRLRIEQTLLPQAQPVPSARAAGPVSTNKTTNVVERIVLTIQAKNYGEPEAVDKWIEMITVEPYFTNHLRRDQPVLLKELQPRQVDPLAPSRTFSFFTTECIYSERLYKDE
jgi:type IV pilus assembly protein PilM